MSQPISIVRPSPLQRFRAGLGRRATGFALALLAEGVLVLLLLTLSPRPTPIPFERDVSVFSVAPEAEPTVEPAPQAPAAAEATDQRPTPQPPAPAEAAPSPAPPQPEPAPWIELSPNQMAVADIKRPTRPPTSAPQAAGPPNIPVPGDSQRVGTAPGGQPLYAASWYREPYPDELRGYLSTASGPGWGLIACRTAPDFRVEDCVAEGEYPEGSKIARAVLAAAWQFRVRPPRVGGQMMVGEWVRIRIDYDLRRR